MTKKATKKDQVEAVTEATEATATETTEATETEATETEATAKAKPERSPEEQAKLDKKMATNLRWEVKNGREVIRLATAKGFSGSVADNGKITVIWAPGVSSSYTNFSSFRKAKIAVGFGQFKTGRELIEEWTAQANQPTIEAAAAIAHNGRQSVMDYLADHLPTWEDKSEQDRNLWLIWIYEARLGQIGEETQQAA